MKIAYSTGFNTVHGKHDNRIVLYIRLKLKNIEREKHEVCLKRFKIHINLINYIRIRTSEKPYKCVVYLKTFNQNINLK